MDENTLSETCPKESSAIKKHQKLMNWFACEFWTKEWIIPISLKTVTTTNQKNPQPSTEVTNTLFKSVSFANHLTVVPLQNSCSLLFLLYKCSYHPSHKVQE